MTKRKDNKGRILREGEIQKADGRYEYRYQDLDGKRRSVYSWRLTETDTVPEGKRECQCLRGLEKQIIRDIQDGIQTNSNQTLNDRWNAYISGKVELKASTVEYYNKLYRYYIRDEIGKMNISSINYSIIKRYFNKLIGEYGMLPSSANTVYTLLHPVFRIAVRDGLLRTNPTEGIMAELKKQSHWTQPKKHALTEEQQMIFLNYVKQSKRFEHWHPLFVCLLGTGCRIGEMLALRWEDISWEENLIFVNLNLVIYGTDGKLNKLHISTPKTMSGKRVIPMFKSVRNALEEEYKRQTNRGFRKDVIDGYTGFIWQNRSGNPATPLIVNYVIDCIIREFNQKETLQAIAECREPKILPKFTAHQLRHTFCTRFCERETDLKIIQEIMGHSDISTTMNVYNESNLNRKRDSFSRLEFMNNVF